MNGRTAEKAIPLQLRSPLKWCHSSALGLLWRRILDSKSSLDAVVPPALRRQAIEVRKLLVLARGRKAGSGLRGGSGAEAEVGRRERSAASEARERRRVERLRSAGLEANKGGDVPTACSSASVRP